MDETYEPEDMISRGLAKMMPKKVDHNERIRKALGVVIDDE